PGIVSRRVWLGSSILGIEASNASVYGWRISANSARVFASSTIWPAYITMTRLARPATTPRSWVMRITDMHSSRCSVPSSSGVLGGTGDLCAMDVLAVFLRQRVDVPAVEAHVALVACRLG